MLLALATSPLLLSCMDFKPAHWAAPKYTAWSSDCSSLVTLLLNNLQHGPCQRSDGKHFKYANQILCFPGAAAGQTGGSCLSLSCCQHHLHMEPAQHLCGGTIANIQVKTPLFHAWMASLRLADTWGKDPSAVAWRGGIYFVFILYFSGNCNVC